MVTAHYTPDLHPADTAARTKVKSRLIMLRHQAGMDRAAFGRLCGTTGPAIREFEAVARWKLSILQRYARGVDHRITVAVAGIPLAQDVETAVLAAITPRSAQHEDELARMLLRLDLVRARRAAGVTQREMAWRLGRASSNTVASWERAVKDISLPKAQRYARVLGGHLTFNLQPAPAPDRVPATV